MEIRVAEHPESALHCAVCKDGLKHFSACCEACGCRLHFSCRALLSGCPTLGCVNAPRSRAQIDASRANQVIADLLVRVVGRRRAAKVAAPALRRSRSPRRVAYRQRVLAFGGLVAALIAMIFVGTGVMVHGVQSVQGRVLSDSRAISTAIDLYRLDTGRNPRTLAELVSAGDGHDCYLREAPKDPWGNPYVYRHYSGRVYELLSYGADGLPGGEDEADDIVFRVGFDPRD